MTSAADIELAVEGRRVQLVGLSCVIDERIGAPFAARVACEVLVDGAPADACALDLVGQPARLLLRIAGVERVFSGLVDRVEDLEAR